MSTIHRSCALLAFQCLTELGHRQVQHGQVHGIEQAGQGDYAEPDPLAACSLWTSHDYLSSRTERMLPAGSLNHAMTGPPRFVSSFHRRIHVWPPGN